MLKYCFPFRSLFSQCYPATLQSSEDKDDKELVASSAVITEILEKISQHFNVKTFPVATELSEDILNIHLHHLQFTSEQDFEESEKDSNTILSLPISQDGHHYGFVHITKELTIHVILDSGVIDTSKDFDNSLEWLEFGEMRKVAIHSGFYTEAKKILPIIYLTLEKAKEELKVKDFFGHQIIVGGHGFAAGVGSVVTILLMVYSSFHGGWLNQSKDCENKTNRFKFIATAVPNAFVGHGAESSLEFLDERNFILFQYRNDSICRIPERALVEPVHPDFVYIFTPVGKIREIEFTREDFAGKRGLKHSLSTLGQGIKRRITTKKAVKSNWSWLLLASKSLNHDKNLYLKNVKRTLMEDKTTSTD